MSKDLTDEEYDKLISIWLFSCVTPNAKIAFKNIEVRYKFPTETDAKQFIGRFEELFLTGIIEAEFNKIIEEFHTKNKADGSGELPAWLFEKGKKDSKGNELKTPQERWKRRNGIINSLDLGSFFSGQVRFSDKSEVAPDEVIKWGIAYIDRLRAKEKEKREKRRNLFKDFAPTLIALAAVLVSLIASYMPIAKQEEIQKKTIDNERLLQAQNAKKERDLKRYETGFSVKLNARPAMFGCNIKVI